MLRVKQKHIEQSEESRPKYYKKQGKCRSVGISPKTLEMSGIDKSSIGVRKDGKIVKSRFRPSDSLNHCALTGKMLLLVDSVVKDMGTPDRYYSVCRSSWCVGFSKEFSNKTKIFLDRDGTINKYVGF